MKEGFYDAEPASDLVESEDLLLTRKGDSLYLHINRDPESSAVSLRPLEVAPQSATLLNTDKATQAIAELTPRSWIEQWQAGMREERGDRPKTFLRVRELPVNDLTDEPMVVKLDFAPGTLPV